MQSFGNHFGGLSRAALLLPPLLASPRAAVPNLGPKPVSSAEGAPRPQAA